MELPVQSICSLFCVIISICQINLYPASVVSSCLMIYKLEKLSDQQFQAKLQCWNPPCIWNSKLCYPPCLQNSSPRNPPLPQNFKMPTMVWYGYFLESPISWHLIYSFSCVWLFQVSNYVTLFTCSIVFSFKWVLKSILIWSGFVEYQTEKTMIIAGNRVRPCYCVAMR